jgi:hypothetical protein
MAGGRESPKATVVEGIDPALPCRPRRWIESPMSSGGHIGSCGRPPGVGGRVRYPWTGPPPPESVHVAYSPHQLAVNQRSFMRARIIDDEMDVQLGRSRVANGHQELSEFSGAVSLWNSPMISPLLASSDGVPHALRARSLDAPPSFAVRVGGHRPRESRPAPTTARPEPEHGMSFRTSLSALAVSSPRVCQGEGSSRSQPV